MAHATRPEQGMPVSAARPFLIVMLLLRLTWGSRHVEPVDPIDPVNSPPRTACRARPARLARLLAVPRGCQAAERTERGGVDRAREGRGRGRHGGSRARPGAAAATPRRQP